VRVAAVGHVEWVEFVRVERLPHAGEILHASEYWEDAAGGGSGAASQLLKLGGNNAFITALGDDHLGRTARARLEALGIDVYAVARSDPTRRAITYVDSSGERTITVIGPRLNPHADDLLPWGLLDETDACFFTAGDAAAIHAARRARVLVATSRFLSVLREASVLLDALVGSENDASEAYRHGELDPMPRLVVRTKGDRGGRYSIEGGEWQTYEPYRIHKPIVDRYGAGDSFAGGLAFGLAAGLDPARAIELAARCGAAVVTGRGPYEAQLTREAISDAIDVSRNAD
jgi:ribokinase